MLAIAALKTGRATKGKSRAAAAAAAVRKRREPTPDHPPYSWMINEAIKALGEDGGSAEAAISGFIRGRHPGVPAGASHDKFLRYYLAKHVAEGLFVCTAPGRYSCRPDEPVLAEVKLAAAASAGSPVTEVKRGRGRPRKDGSPAKPAAGKESGSKSLSATPKRRGRPRKLELGTTTDVSCEALVTAPSTTDENHGQPRDLQLVIVNDGYTTPSFAENDGGETPSAKLALVAKDDGAAAFTTPELVPVPAHGSALASVADKTDCTEAPSTKRRRSRLPCKSAPENAAHDSAPKSSTDKKVGGKAVANDGYTTPSFREKDGSEAPSAKLALLAAEDGAAAFTTPQRSTQPCKLVPVPADDGSAPASVADKMDVTEAPSAKYTRRRQPSESAPVNATHSSAPKSTAGKKVGAKSVSATPKGRGQQRKPAGDSTPTLTAGKKDGNGAQPVPIKLRTQPRKLFPLNSDEVPDDPMFCLLALPVQMPAITMA